MTADPNQANPEKPPCRHEFVKIYQRKLKGLERRLVATKAYLPVGFKMADFGHLSEGSYCFCSNCRARLYPKRTQQDKLDARIALAASKLEKAAASDAAYRLAEGLDPIEPVDAAESAETDEEETMAPATGMDIHIEELEIESVELEDLEEGSVSIPEDENKCDV